MGTSVNQITAAKTVYHPAQTQKPEQDIKVSANSETSLINLGECCENSSSNVFLKEYIEGKALNQGIKIPDGVSIKITSPKEFSKEFVKFLRSISKDIYGARVLDLMNLLEKPAEEVQAKVEQMKISEEEKSKILKLKVLFDSYYKIEVDFNGDRINILNPSEDDQNKLNDISPEFANFIKAENPELQKHAIEFTRKEIQRLQLDDAGQNSAVAAGGLAAILLGLLGKGVWESREDAKLLKANKALFLKNQAEIFKEGVPKLTNPFKEFVAAAKNGLTKSRAKNPKALVLSALLATTLAGSADDLMGAVKDSIQDGDNFGWDTSAAINIPAAAFGILTSAAIAPMIEGQVSYNRAAKYLKKHSGDIKNLGIKVSGLEKVGTVKNIMRKGGKTALFAAGSMLLANAVKGVITASSSSGSSWGSMAGTRIVMERNGNKLEEKNIISKEENTLKGTTDNMMAYEAYSGKWTGIAQQDPLIGSVGGATGLFTHSNPYIQSLSFGLQGCSETLTACYYQVTGAGDRNDALTKDKQALVESTKQK